MSREIPKRFPPSPDMRVRRGKDGLIYPVERTEPFIPECGQLARLRGEGLVVCIRRKGHPVAINYGHSNGYVEWCFDEEEA